MNAHVTMSLFETIVFTNVMQIITPDDDGPLHFHLLDDASKDAAANRHVSGERTFLVDVGAFDRLNREKQRKIRQTFTRKRVHGKHLLPVNCYFLRRCKYKSNTETIECSLTIVINFAITKRNNQDAHFSIVLVTVRTKNLCKILIIFLRTRFVEINCRIGNILIEIKKKKTNDNLFLKL